MALVFVKTKIVFQALIILHEANVRKLRKICIHNEVTSVFYVLDPLIFDTQSCMCKHKCFRDTHVIHHPGILSSHDKAPDEGRVVCHLST